MSLLPTASTTSTTPNDCLGGSKSDLLVALLVLNEIM